jgi:hypothetical protein
VCQKLLLGLTLLVAACSSDESVAARGSPVEAGADRAMHESEPKVEAGPDGSVPEAGLGDGKPDDRADAPDADAGIACGKLREAWRAFVVANRGCKTDADCVVVGDTAACRCEPSLGDPSGDAISASAADGSKLYFERYYECIAAGHDFASSCDAAPAKNLRCESGTCTADLNYCIPDGGGD